MDKAIYAFRGSSDWCDIFASLQKGDGRFGWSYIPTADLRQLQKRIDGGEWDKLTDQEKDCYQSFLLDMKDGDYVVYINVPAWGKCTLARVTGGYEWRYEDKDFNHRFPVDPSSVYTFDRNSASVHPALGARLKLQGRWWRIYKHKEFMDLVDFLKAGGKSVQKTPQANLQFLSAQIEPCLLDITRHIHNTHPNYDLECLLAEVFKKVPGVIDVKWQGGAGDHGADIIVTYESGFPIPGMEKQSVLLVQVKSFYGKHSDTKAVNDIERAFRHYPDASMGLIISTADSASDEVTEALDKLREASGKQIGLLIGPNVAAFLLRYGAKLLN